MKKKRIIIFLFSVITIFTLVFIVTRFILNDSLSKRKLWTLHSLENIRASIKTFYDDKQRNPVSIEELKKYCYEKKIDLTGGRLKEYISDANGNSTVYDTLSNQGGWCYNKDSGEIRVNLTSPVKKYIKNYFGPERNNKPCDW